MPSSHVICAETDFHLYATTSHFVHALNVKSVSSKSISMATMKGNSVRFSARVIPSAFLIILSAPLPSLPPTVRRVPPRFSIPPTDNEIMPGGSVNITCVAVGSPMPYVKWMLGAEDLTPEDDMPIGRNVLELTDVRQSANYTCVAMSTLGVIEAVAQITVKGEAA